MNRREFFRRSSLIAAGVIAADQLELLEKLAHSKVFQGADFAPPIILDPKYGPLVTLANLDEATKRVYRSPDFYVPERFVSRVRIQ